MENAPGWKIAPWAMNGASNLEETGALQWKRIRSDFCPALFSENPTRLSKGGMDAAPASIAFSTESTTQQNRGAKEQIISATNYLNCSYYFAHLKSAIDLLLGLLPADELAAVDGEDPFYRECRDAINAQAANRLGVSASVDDLINLDGIDRKKGAQEVITCAIQRWGTVSESAWALFPSCLVFAIGIVKRYSDGTEAVKQNAIVALCSYEGFISEHHHKIKLERHAERPFLTLTNASDLLQMAIVRSLNVLCIRIFLKFASEDNDCGNGMKGQDSAPRNVLLGESLSSPETFGF